MAPTLMHTMMKAVLGPVAVLQRRFPGIPVLGPEEPGWRLSESPAADEYPDLLASRMPVKGLAGGETRIP